MPPGSTYEAIFVGSRENNSDHFKGTLPSDGDYIIRIYLMGDAKDSGKPINYTLKVGIPASGKSSAATTGSSSSNVKTAEQNCLAAVAKTVGISSSKLSVSYSSEAESGIGIDIKVPDATDLWFCLTDRKGKVQNVRSKVQKGDCKTQHQTKALFGCLCLYTGPFSKTVLMYQRVQKER